MNNSDLISSLQKTYKELIITRETLKSQLEEEQSFITKAIIQEPQTDNDYPLSKHKKWIDYLMESLVKINDDIKKVSVALEKQEQNEKQKGE